MNRKALFVVSTVALLAVFAAGAFLYRSTGSSQANAAAAASQANLVRFHSATLGPADARVQIVEFLDPACETCREFYPFVKSLLAGSPDRIRLSVRHVALHAGSEFPIRALEAAKRQGKYWQALEALLAAQPTWAINHRVQPERVMEALGGVGLDMERLQKEMNDAEITRVIELDLADARALKVSKTPEFFVNGKQMPTFGFQQLRKLVVDELNDAYR